MRSPRHHAAARRRPAARLTPLARAIAGAGLLATPLWLQAAGALPTGLQVAAGQAQVSTQGAQMTVRNTPGAILNWQTFSIGAANKLWFEQANAASKVLNRVVGNEPSSILGQLGSNGQVWLLNPNGVLFGAGARVDVAALVASTLRLNDNDFLAGRYRFSALDGDAGRLRNEGQLSTSFGGQVVLLAPRVENSGEISAPEGRVTLASARSAELVDTGLPNLAVRVTAPAGETLNLGRLVSDGGTVDLYGSIVNQHGVVQADTLRADAAGNVVLRAADTLTLGEASLTRAAGGQVDLLGTQVGVLGRATVDVSAPAGGGGIRLGGGLMGQDRSVPNARAVYVGPEATLRADASGDSGAGGRIVVWSDAATRVYGSLSARGGAAAGDGGFIETSGGWLDARPARVDLSTRGGRAGSWLLDPNDITINDAGPDTNVAGGPNFTSTNDASVLSTATIAAALNAGNSVTVSTGSAGSNLQAGDIVMNGATLNVNPAAAVSLSLNASRDVIVRGSTISSAGAALSLNLVSAGSGVGAIEISNAAINTAGGNLTLRGAQQVGLPVAGSGAIAFFQPAVGYVAAQQPVASQLLQATAGVHLNASQLNLGSGSFSALGVGATAGVSQGIRMGGANMQLAAGSASLRGWASSGLSDEGVLISGNSTDLTATAGLTIVGYGRSTGVHLGPGGARLALLAPGNPNAVLQVIGESTVHAGVVVEDASPSGGRGTPITVVGGRLALAGIAGTNQPGLWVDSGGALGSPVPAAPTLDLVAASQLQLNGRSNAGSGMELTRVRIAGPLAGNSTISTSNGVLRMEQVDLTGSGALSLSGPSVSLSLSSLAAAGAPLSLDFATLGANPQGVQITNSVLATNDGDVRFGALQQVCSPILGCSAAGTPWVESAIQISSASGLCYGALCLEGASIEAGNGRVYGGGAARTTATDTNGVTIADSVVRAREISIAGRSETGSGLDVGSVVLLSATKVLELDALSSFTNWTGMSISRGPTLQVVDPTSDPTSRLVLSATHLGDRTTALDISGGDVGTAAETTIIANGARLVLSGTVAGTNAADTAVRLAGTVAAPGGLTIDALAATGVEINALNEGVLGRALQASNMNILGPQADALSRMDITARGGRTAGAASTTFDKLTLSSAGSVRLVTDGLVVGNSRLSADAGLELLTNTAAAGSTASSLSVTGSTLAADGAGALLRIGGDAGDGVRGDSGLNAGQGITLTDSTLQARGLGGRIQLEGRGADAGGSGVVFTRTQMTAERLQITGVGVVDGHGVLSEDFSNGVRSHLRVNDLLIDGTSANDPAAPSRAGVLLGDGVTLTLNNRGNASIAGDTVVLGSDGGPQPFLADGDAASFVVSSTGSLRLRNGTLDFSSGFGTSVSLLADVDAQAGGRVRLEQFSLLSGGGPVLMAGSGEVLGPNDLQNTTVRQGSIGLLANTFTLDTAGGSVAMTSQGGGASFTAGNLNVGNLILSSTDAVVIGATSINASGDLLLDASGLAGGFGLIDVSNSDLSAGGLLRLEGIQAQGGDAVRLGDATQLRGADVVINGSSLGGGGVVFADTTGSSTVTATTGTLQIGGGTPGGPGVNIEGGWVFQSPTDILIGSDNTLRVSPLGGQPLFLAGQNFRLSVFAPLGLSLGDGSTLDGTQLGASLAFMQPDSTTTLEVRGNINALNVTGPLSVPSRLQVLADGIELKPGALLRSTAPGDAIVVGGTSTPQALFLDNTGGAGVLDAPAGRWVLRLTDPRQNNLGGLVPDFSAYDLAARPWFTDGLGNLVTPAPGNAVGYAVPTSALAGQGLSGQLTKLYDGSANITLDPGTWLLSGLMVGDTMGIAGITTALLPDKNVGIGRAVSLSPGSVFSVTDAAGRPVFGYDAPVFTADVTPRSVVLNGAAVANKVYDGGTAAAMASLGNVASLAGDVVAVGGAVVANFADRNVGAGKAVAVNGLALVGADAGNYTLVAPGAFSADITPRPLALAGLAALNKVYDATATATLAGNAAITPVAGDAVALAGAAVGSFANKNAGLAKPVTVAGLALAGADAGNYTLQLPTLAADIAPAPLALAGLSALSRSYDGSTLVTLGGAASINPLAGDTVSLAGAATGSVASRNIGLGKAVTVAGVALAGADAANYSLLLPQGLTADVTPALLTLQGVAAASKVYDGNTNAAMSGALAGVVAGDGVTLNLSGQFADRNVGNAKRVDYGATLAGADVGNYTLAGATGSTSAGITPAALRYVAAPATGTAGQPLPVLTGTVAGFVGGDTLGTATSGTLRWTTPADGTSPAGAYAIVGGGLAATNYLFSQDPGNTRALTLRAVTTSDPATTTTTVITVSALASVQVPVAMSTPTQGRVLDVTLAFAPSSATAGEAATAAGAVAAPAGAATAGAADAGSMASISNARSASEVAGSLAALSAGEASDGLTFRALDWSRLPRDEVQTLLAARARYKQKVFSKGVSQLQQDPSLADVRPCRNEAELQTGQCVITEQLKAEIQAAIARRNEVAVPRRDGARRVKAAALPTIERKLALVIGVNRYADKRVPELMGAVPDARAVRSLLESRLGYETTVLENPSREAIVRAFNKLALEAQANDSVIVYYAGHGVLVPIEGVDTGFWLASDADAETPGTWLANADIARMVAAVGARQMMLVSDSCYSGALAGKDRVQLGTGDDATDMLKRKASVIMSSGGDEPVADQGRDGHSIFAWHFMRALEGLDRWQVGGSLYERVRAAVQKDFPQTPQYGASRAAGHQGNTDYLFERREFEGSAP